MFWKQTHSFAAFAVAIAASTVGSVHAQPIGPEFRVNTFTPNEQDDPAVGMDAAGNFVVAWESFLQEEAGGVANEVYFQRYDADGNPLGDETRANQAIDGTQDECDIAVAPDGYFVITWESAVELNGTVRNVWARVFNSDGTARTNEFRVNETTEGQQDCPEVAIYANGFVIAWEGEEETEGGGGGDIYFRLYASDGTPITGEVLANAITDGSQDDEDVAMDAAGNFVITWESQAGFVDDGGSDDDIYARRFAANGVPLDSEEFRVNTVTEGDQDDPAVARDAAGNFTIVWEGPDGEEPGGNGDDGIYGQSYDSSGDPDGGEFQVNTTEEGDQQDAKLARNADGIVVVWEGDGENPLGSNDDVFCQVFGPDSARRGTEARVNSTVDNDQDQPDVAMNANGDIVVCWESTDDNPDGGDNDDIFAQRFGPGTLSGHGGDRVSASEKGSLLVYTAVELRWENTPPYNLIQDTFVHITNDYPAAVDVKMFFVNGDDPAFAAHWEGGDEGASDVDILNGGMSESRWTGGNDGGVGQGGGGGEDGGREHPGWNWLDNVISLTANEPAYWAASTGLPKGVSPWGTLDPGPPPGRPDPANADERHLRGYILAFAVDSVDGGQIRWNHLAGDATVVNYSDESAWEYNAYTFPVVDGTPHGQPTGGTPGHLALDGTEYANAYSHLLMNFIASGSSAYSGATTPITHDTDLTLAPVYWDHRQETDGPVTVKASFDIWNENEVKFTNLDRCVTCWDQELLSNHAIPNHFLVESLHTNAGKARIDGLESILCEDSQAAPFLGVSQKLLSFNASAGNNLIGLGREGGMLWYDLHGPPPESNWIPTTPEEVGDFIDRMIKEIR